MYYAAVNSYANETSIGFANTWGVVRFADKATRDEFVSEATDVATRAILAKEVKNYGGVSADYKEGDLYPL